MNKFDDSEKKLLDVSIIDAEKVTSDFNEGYGSDFYEITDKYIKQLQEGKILSFSSQGEYRVYIKLKKKE